MNAYGLTIRSQDNLPHVDEEFGILARIFHPFLLRGTKSTTSAALNGNLCLLTYKQYVPHPNQSVALHPQHFSASRDETHEISGLVTLGGDQSFALADTTHHSMVFCVLESFELDLRGINLEAQWFNPRDPNATLGTPFSVSAGLNQLFTPPIPQFDDDWILWVKDGTNLDDPVIHPTGDAQLIQQIVGDPGDFDPLLSHFWDLKTLAFQATTSVCCLG